MVVVLEVYICFPQIPKQLFKKPHPQKRVMQKPSGADQESNSLSTFSISPSSDKVFYRHLDNLKHSSTPVKGTSRFSPKSGSVVFGFKLILDMFVTELKSAVSEIIPAERGLFAVEKNKLLIPPQFSRYLSWGNSDLSIRIGYYESDRAMQVCKVLIPYPVNLELSILAIQLTFITLYINDALYHEPLP